MSTVEWNTTPCVRSTLLHDRAIKLSQAKKYTSTQIPSFVLERCATILLLHRSGKNKLDGSSVSRAIKNFMESTESHLSSTVMFSQGTMHCNYSNTLQPKLQHAQSNQKISEIGSSSCRCTVTSIGREVKKTSINVFRILRKLGITHTDSRRDIGLFSVR